MKRRSSFAVKLKKARKAVGLSQKDLGKMLELSDKAISSYEVGRAHPSIDILKKIGEITHKPIQYFLEDETSLEIDIQSRIKSIESELAAIRKLLVKNA